jgi:hypothetical protein
MQQPAQALEQPNDMISEGIGPKLAGMARKSPPRLYCPAFRLDPRQNGQHGVTAVCGATKLTGLLPEWAQPSREPIEISGQTAIWVSELLNRDTGPC